MDVSEYDEGRGKVKVRARIEARGDKTVVIREIPYGTTTESLIASIEDGVTEGPGQDHRHRRLHHRQGRDRARRSRAASTPTR